jgi:hypothetical protein
MSCPSCGRQTRLQVDIGGALVWVCGRYPDCRRLNNEPQEGGRRELGPAGCDPETSGESEQPRPLPSCDSVTAAAFRADPSGTLQRATERPVTVTDDAGRVVGVLSVPTDRLDEPDELAATRSFIVEVNQSTEVYSQLTYSLIGAANTLLRMVDELRARVLEDDKVRARSGFVLLAMKERDELRARLSHAEDLVGCPRDGELHVHILAHLDSHDQLTQERDELRAKLRESEARVTALRADLRAAIVEADERVAKVYRTWKNCAAVEEQRYVDEYTRRVAAEQRTEAAEAKLADTEKDRDAYVIELEQMRAELAEADIKLLNENVDRNLERERAEAAEARVLAVEARARKLAEALFAATSGHVDLDKLEGKQ